MIVGDTCSSYCDARQDRALATDSCWSRRACRCRSRSRSCSTSRATRGRSPSPDRRRPRAGPLGRRAAVRRRAARDPAVRAAADAQLSAWLKPDGRPGRAGDRRHRRGRPVRLRRHQSNASSTRSSTAAGGSSRRPRRPAASPRRAHAGSWRRGGRRRASSSSRSPGSPTATPTKVKSVGRAATASRRSPSAAPPAAAARSTA